MLTGGCQCGALRYRADAEPLRIYCCHCSECRAQSAPAFGISVIVPVDAVSLMQGGPRIWRRTTARGKVLACAFCPDCGSRIRHGNEPAEDVLSIKGGSVDGGVDLRNAQHIWTSGKLPGGVIPENAICWPQEHD